MIRQAAFAVIISLATGALAQAADLGARKSAPMPPPSAACKENKGLPADAFGFATGSDVADLGVWSIALDTVAANGLRGGTAYTLTPLVQLSGSFFPCLEVGPYVFAGFGSFKPYGGGIRTDTSAFGGGIELKYKVLGRAPHGIGLTFAVAPNVQRQNNSPGADPTVFANSYRILADAELIAGRLFGTLNLELFQTMPINTPAPNTSSFAIRGALTAQVIDNFYLGAEASYQRGYTGQWLRRYQADAVYLGPTFFWQINDKFSLNGTWAYQLAGDTRVNPGRALGIDFFPRHQGRLKLAYAF